MIYSQIDRFFRSIWNAFLGITVEVAVVAFFIFAGFVVSILWWGIFR